jgi:hypothetical protein
MVHGVWCMVQVCYGAAVIWFCLVMRILLICSVLKMCGVGDAVW